MALALEGRHGDQDAGHEARVASRNRLLAARGELGQRRFGVRILGAVAERDEHLGGDRRRHRLVVERGGADKLDVPQAQVRRLALDRAPAVGVHGLRPQHVRHLDQVSHRRELADGEAHDGMPEECAEQRLDARGLEGERVLSTDAQQVAIEFEGEGAPA